MGRSLAYRFGAFHLLASMAQRQALPPELDPAQVRCALTAVIHKVMQQAGTFDPQGWLTIGLCGHQPSLGEPYVSTGSLYLCLCGLLPLGLPPDNEFWSSAPADWSSKKSGPVKTLPMTMRCRNPSLQRWAESTAVLLLSSAGDSRHGWHAQTNNSTFAAL